VKGVLFSVDFNRVVTQYASLEATTGMETRTKNLVDDILSILTVAGRIALEIAIRPVTSAAAAIALMLVGTFLHC
jgi:hypothetical protein